MLHSNDITYLGGTLIIVGTIYYIHDTTNVCDTTSVVDNTNVCDTTNVVDTFKSPSKIATASAIDHFSYTVLVVAVASYIHQLCVPIVHRQ